MTCQSTTNRQRQRKITKQYNINFNQKRGTCRGQASLLIGQRTARLFNGCTILLYALVKTSVLPVIQPLWLSDYQTFGWRAYKCGDNLSTCCQPFTLENVHPIFTYFWLCFFFLIHFWEIVKNCDVLLCSVLWATLEIVQTDLKHIAFGSYNTCSYKACVLVLL